MEGNKIITFALETSEKNQILNFAKFVEIYLCRSLFFIKVASELCQNVMSNLFIEHLRTTTSENERLSFVQNF